MEAADLLVLLVIASGIFTMGYISGEASKYSNLEIIERGCAEYIIENNEKVFKWKDLK